ncbi:hypothetical protein C8Q75DRAFT_133464 [Abortiporus biennis]|nr:hypothetical protein C8Q75DRAFT_133464 [Abortiporus biennis]
MYANRVNELVPPRQYQKSRFCRNLDDSALQALFNTAVFETTDGHRVHFPEIRVLEWPFTGIDGNFFHLVDHFLGMKMQKIALRGYLQRDINTDDTMSMLWSAIPIRCPELIEFKMTEFSPFVPPSHDMSAWKSLKIFDCGRSYGMPIEIYAALSKLPRLHRVNFYPIQRTNILEENQSSETLNPVVDPTFPSLHHLTLISEEIENCIDVLQHNSYPVLAELFIGLNFRSGPSPIHSGSFGLDLLEIIPRRVSSNLRHLLIQGYHYDPPFPNPRSHHSPQMLHIIRSMLQAFPNMEHFELQSCQFTFDINRTFLTEIAAAWPKLKRLAFTPYYPCPFLLCLWIRVDANGSQSIPGLNPTSERNSSLQRLYLGESSIHSAENVIEFLLHSFPKLQYLEAWRYSTPNGAEEKRYRKQWKMVEKKVNKIKTPVEIWF